MINKYTKGLLIVSVDKYLTNTPFLCFFVTVTLTIQNLYIGNYNIILGDVCFMAIIIFLTHEVF